MPITVTIDERLAAAAQRLTGHASAQAAVEHILQQATTTAIDPVQGMLELAGTNPLRDDYDYKALRLDLNIATP